MGFFLKELLMALAFYPGFLSGPPSGGFSSALFRCCLGKAPVSLVPGKAVMIPAGVNHWHGAKSDSWFSHITVEVPGKKRRNEWVAPVNDKQYTKANEAINNH